MSQAQSRDWDRWSVHMDGLARISNLRGGFDGLGDHIPILTSWYEDNCPLLHRIPEKVYFGPDRPLGWT